jgi:hypothetical protein
MRDIQIVGNFLKIHLPLFKGNFKKELVLIAESNGKKDEYEHLTNAKWIIRNQAPKYRFCEVYGEGSESRWRSVFGS